MADALSDGEAPVVKPPPKRRRILDSSAIVPVPIYSNKVNSSLSLKAELPALTEKERTDDDGVDSLWLQMSSQATRAAALVISDSEEEQEVQLVDDSRDKGGCRSQSPPPPPSEIPVQKQSRNFQKKINEVDRKLRAISATLSPEGRDVGLRRRRGRIPEQDEDDVVILEMEPRDLWAQESRLKVRCRTDVYKLSVLSTTSVGEVASQLSAILQVPSHRLLLLREEAELPSHASISELGLGITDILECVVMATEQVGIITVRLQGKERGSTRDFSVHKEAELGSIFSQYVSAMPASARRKVQFHFDGCKVTAKQTPAQLDMEDGDIIEVWM
ncbi:NFATC2-interacting protein [Dunckerocampus dactyliophorus]|uniref:NFATC2-interacting protein n=1 Tax=Dunckerocampus dactyliophorus TaxID=161453 RepID=UPI002406EFD3|nr:NFATC2-interacting protein [Dunckerocampus dactyliophorus]